MKNRKRNIRWGQPPYEKRRYKLNTYVPETWFKIRFSPMADALGMSYSNFIALILKNTLLKPPWWLQKILAEETRGKTFAQVFKEGEALLVKQRTEEAGRDYVKEIRMEEEAYQEKIRKETEQRLGR